MEKSVDQMNVGRSYPLWDSFLNEKLKKLQISTDVKQEVIIPDIDTSTRDPRNKSGRSQTKRFGPGPRTELDQQN